MLAFFGPFMRSMLKMPSKSTVVANSVLGELDRTAAGQAAENLVQALRVLDLVPLADSQLTPHPIYVVRAEIENARRYLTLAMNPA
jgi:hypothetical protein